MTNPVKYKGTYTDSSGTTAITITNNFKTLSCEIDGIRFEGMEFSDFVIIDKANYTDEQLKRFSFVPMPVDRPDLIENTLYNCEISLIVPQLIIDQTTNTAFYVDLKIDYALGTQSYKPDGKPEHELVKLSLTIGKQNFEAIDPHYIEMAFNEIKKQFDSKYQFKNCYGCMFGDYSVYGQAGFGTMLCFVRQKEAYIQVKDKDEYMELTDDFDIVQEIYCCDNYEIRKDGVGFRG